MLIIKHVNEKQCLSKQSNKSASQVKTRTRYLQLTHFDKRLQYEFGIGLRSARMAAVAVLGAAAEVKSVTKFFIKVNTERMVLSKNRAFLLPENL